MISDHYDGRHFFNPGAPEQRRFFAFVRWMVTRRKKPWPRRLAATEPDGPPPAPGPGAIAATFVNQSTFLLHLGGVRVLTDPVWSERASPVRWAGPRRARPPGLAFETLPPIDLVLLSHNHYDHMDLPTLRRLQERFNPPILTTLGNRYYLRRRGLTRAQELDWWQSLEGPRGMKITLTPARHFSARGPFDRNHTLWGGFLLRSGPAQVFFAGDTGYGPHFHTIAGRAGPVDLALLPIGAYEPRWFFEPAHMCPDEAVQAHLDLTPRLSIGMHFGTFRMTDEAIDDPARALARALAQRGVEPARFRVPGFGETIVLGSR